jgi:hypothetical protein
MISVKCRDAKFIITVHFYCEDSLITFLVPTLNAHIDLQNTRIYMGLQNSRYDYIVFSILSITLHVTYM